MNKIKLVMLCTLWLSVFPLSAWADGKLAIVISNHTDEDIEFIPRRNFSS